MDGKRDEDRRLKQEKVTALQDQSKQSLTSGQQGRRKLQQNNVNLVPGNNPSADGDHLSETSSASDSSSQRRERTKKAAHKGYLPSDVYAPAASPMKELEDEEEEDGNVNVKQQALIDGVVTPTDLNSVPWHHAQLYKMYGRHADYYIHPKMQPEKKKIVNPTLKTQKVRKMGHMGASHIWTTLRTDSKSKLFRTDRRFPQELKDAFSAHVREGITKHQKPVFRNFTETEDVPDLNRLMDQSLLRRIRILRHKTELMYRSSQTNNDRTKVLLFNSPLPAVTEGDEGIDKYLPSWDDMASEHSEASYMKWLKNAVDGELKGLDELSTEDDAEDGDNKAAPKVTKRHPVSVLSPVGSDVSDGLQAIWHSIMARQRPRKQPRYHFLTEKEAQSQGAFLEKLGLDKDKLDMGRTDLSGNNTRLSLPSIKAFSAQDGRSTRHSEAGLSQSRSESAQQSHTSSLESRWQPLSMHALIEYKDQMTTEGHGDFQQGRPKMWNLATVSQE